MSARANDAVKKFGKKLISQIKSINMINKNPTDKDTACGV
jgi:hypothetical protein